MEKFEKLAFCPIFPRSFSQQLVPLRSLVPPSPFRAATLRAKTNPRPFFFFDNATAEYNRISIREKLCRSAEILLVRIAVFNDYPVVFQRQMMKFASLAGCTKIELHWRLFITSNTEQQHPRYADRSHGKPPLATPVANSAHRALSRCKSKGLVAPNSSPRHHACSPASDVRTDYTWGFRPAPPHCPA